MLETGKRKGSAMNIEIAQRLYELRREHGFSQESLAAELGLSRQAISKWERSESAPDMGNLIALADLYDMTIDELIRPETESEGEAEAETAVEDAETIEEVEEADTATIFEDEVVADTEREPFTEPASNAESAVTQEAAPIQEPTIDIKQVSAHGHIFARPPQPTPRPRCALRRFPYPLAVTALFLLLALVFGLWEYIWLFLTIPFYYWICRIIERDPNFLAAHGYSEGGR